MNKFLTLAALTVSIACGAAMPAQAQSVQVRDFDVYVDLPTGFAFIRTPMGWKFIRQLDERQMAHLHPTTLTTLLPQEMPEIRYAHPALELSPRRLAQRNSEGRETARISVVQVGG